MVLEPKSSPTHNEKPHFFLEIVILREFSNPTEGYICGYNGFLHKKLGWNGCIEASCTSWNLCPFKKLEIWTSGPKNWIFLAVFHERNDCFKVIFGLFSQGRDTGRSKIDWNGCAEAFYTLSDLYPTKKLEIWTSRPPKLDFWDYISGQKWCSKVVFGLIN